MNEIIRTEKIKEIETIGAAKAGEDIIKDTFDYEPLQKEIINNIFVSSSIVLRCFLFPLLFIFLFYGGKSCLHN